MASCPSNGLLARSYTRRRHVQILMLPIMQILIFSSQFTETILSLGGVHCCPEHVVCIHLRIKHTYRRCTFICRAMLRDEKRFGPNPDEFRPERFLQPGVADPFDFAFGFGRRWVFETSYRRRNAHTPCAGYAQVAIWQTI